MRETIGGVGRVAGSGIPAVSTTAAPAIAVEGLVKAYGAVRAVDGLDFTVAPGEIFALLGPNGAGKTTTLEILEGYRAPDAGTVRVLGLDPWRDGGRLKPRIGVMLQADGLHPGLTAREILRLYAGFFERSEGADALLDRVGLRAAAGVRCRRLSGGQKRRLALAVAFVGRPALLFLDEPTTGMDPQARLATWDLVREARDAGTTILLTTHLLDEAERLADRVAIVDGGRLVALDTPGALTRRAEGAGAGATIPIRLVAAPGLPLAALAALPGARAAREAEPGVYALEAAAADGAGLLAALTAWLRDHEVTLRELRVGGGSLEEVFLRLTGREDRGP
jgi:ABC-2 type transport system ATP-binding protein